MEIAKKFLVDTDILIDFLRGVEKTRDFLLQLRQEGEAAISVVSVMEIYSGKDIRSSTKRKSIDEFLSNFEIIAFGEGLAKTAGRIRLTHQTPFADAIVAATALSRKAILVTNNIKHFSQIKNLEILQV